MTPETFEKQLRQELKNHNREEIAHFAWHCAVRALPFLGTQGNFTFWKEKDRLSYIYAIFYALDVNASGTYSLQAYSAATAAADAAISTSASAAAAFAASAAAATAAAAAYAVAAADIDADIEDVTSAAFTAAAFADAAFTYATYATFSNAKNGISLRSIILKDLKTRRNSTGMGYANLPILYNSVWINFQKALDAEECTFWGQLYQNIFEKGFVLKEEAIERIRIVPPEIREKGASKVANYLDALEKQGAERLNEARIIILGEKGAGKTCLARRLVDPNALMTSDYESTSGVDTTLWKLREENINVHIWDFAGHTVTHAVHQLFLSERCLYVIVYDGRTEERNRLEYWLNHIKNYGGDSKAIILVNQRDKHSVKIPINFLKEQYPIQGVYTFSIQDDKEGLSNFRKEVSGFIQNNPSWNSQLIPANYYRVKNALEELFVNSKKDERKERISIEEFRTIAIKNGITQNEIEKLLTYLHILGISLRYNDLKNTLVLNPEWISYGVYKIINWTNEEKKFTLTIYDFAKVFEADIKRYPEDQFSFLFELMKKYELAYETKVGNTLIIPHLLNEDQPTKLPDFPVGESLMLRYKAEQPLPPNTISRFIVRHNEQIRKEEANQLVWRSGVILRDSKGSIALVREEDRTISVSVKGHNKTNYISILRETLNDIFYIYKSKKPELQYRIEQFGPMKTEEEHWESERKIRNHTSNRIPYFDDISGLPFDMGKVSGEYNINIESVGNLMFGGYKNQFTDNSINNTFNFHECNIGLQGSLNDLARKLTKSGNKEEAEELKEAVELLEEAENCKTKEEVKKKGIARSLQQLAEKLGDEDSKLHKTVEGIKSGIGIAQDIAKGYNDAAQWLGLPQVPKPFLKKETN